MKLGIPEVWVSRWWIVTPAHVSGASGIHFLTRSPVASLPCSSRINTAIPVNCFVIDPSRNFVSGAASIPHSSTALPYPRLSTGLPSRATSTVP